MVMVCKLAFWCSVSMLVYIYAGYPCFVFLLSRWFGRPVCQRPVEPAVTVVISAYNEQEVIETTVENKIAQDYPPDRLDVLVVSDGSTDETDHRVRALAEKYPGRVRLLRQAPRAGKTAALNMAMQQVTREIVVFSDANSIYSNNAIRMLTRNFADPSVGYVTGKMIYASAGDSASAEGCSLYMRYENFLRVHETGIGSVVGVDGGVDVVRKELFVPMRDDQLPDFVLPLQVVSQGFRVVYEHEAILREPALSSFSDEFRMRVRVSLRALWALYDMRHLFNVFRYGLFAVQLFSHKLLRYTVFMFLFIAAGTSFALADDNVIYQLALGAQVLFYVLAGWGYARSRAGLHSRIGYVPYYFMLLNLASAQAFSKFLAGKKQVIWNPRTG